MVILIDAAEAAVLTGYHRIYIYTLMRKGDFPEAIYVPQHGKRPGTHFRKVDIESWVAKRAAIKVAKRVAQAGMQVAV